MHDDGAALIFARIQHPLDHVPVGQVGIGHIKGSALDLRLHLTLDIYPLGESELTTYQ